MNKQIFVGIYTVAMFHVGAKSALLRRLFMPMAKKDVIRPPLDPPFQLRPVVLGSQLAGRPAGGIFPD